MDDADEVAPVAVSAQVAAALKVARIIVTATTVAADAGEALNDRQQVALLTAALLEFDGYKVDVDGLLEVEQLLAKAGRNGDTAH